MYPILFHQSDVVCFDRHASWKTRGARIQAGFSGLRNKDNLPTVHQSTNARWRQLIFKPRWRHVQSKCFLRGIVLSFPSSITVGDPPKAVPGDEPFFRNTVPCQRGGVSLPSTGAAEKQLHMREGGAVMLQGAKLTDVLFSCRAG